MKIRNDGLSVLPQFIWSLIQNRSYRDSILNVAHCVNCFCPEDLSMLVSLTMVLEISCKVLFFRSTTPFCWGVLGQEKSWEMPFSLKNSSNFLFSNSPPWSLMTLTILRYFSFWIGYRMQRTQNVTRPCVLRTLPMYICYSHLQSVTHTSWH